jgi:hypothetical protein
LSAEFDWSRSGGPPGGDEIEVTVIGPGFGESILVHVGNGHWLVVDSCIDTRADSESAAPLAYLNAIGVDATRQVDLIVATHWHQDHIRGLAQLVNRCPHAVFSCASALLKQEFALYALATGRPLTTTFESKPAEFLEVMRTLRAREKRVRFAEARKDLFTWSSGGVPTCRVVALSPSDEEYDRFLRRVIELTPQPHQPRVAAVAGPNDVSVVLHITWPDEVSVLLGADMEVKGDDTRGWKAIMIEHASLALSRSTVVKVPHHGSNNAHFEPMWTHGLAPDPIAVVAPYGRGALESRPPTRDDLARINSLARRSYLTSSPRGTSRERFESAVERTLDEGGIEISDATPVFGMVQLRRRGGLWHERLLPPAMPIRAAL